MSKLEEMLHTLDICKKYLPFNVHPAHLERLREIEAVIKAAKDEKQNRETC